MLAMFEIKEPQEDYIGISSQFLLTMQHSCAHNCSKPTLLIKNTHDMKKIQALFSIELHKNIFVGL
jgi:hypothetical protein